MIVIAVLYLLFFFVGLAAVKTYNNKVLRNLIAQCIKFNRRRSQKQPVTATTATLERYVFRRDCD